MLENLIISYLQLFKHTFFRWVLFGGVLFLGVHNTLLGQKIDEPNTSKWLSDKGFENIQVYEQGDTAFVFWENRIYRFEVLAISEVLKKMPLPSTEISVFIPKYSNISMLSLIVNNKDLMRYREGGLQAASLLKTITFSLGVDSSRRKVKGENITESTRGKFDISVEPLLQYQLGNYNNPIRAKFSAVPTVDVQIANGLNLKGQMAIPLYNDYNEDNSIAANLITLSQNVRLEENLFFTATAGYFSLRRFGLDFHLKQYLMNGNLGVNIKAGYTMPSNISGNLELPFQEDDNYLTASLGVDYRIPKYDLLFKLDYGIFLFNDQGLRAEILRQFSEVNIGFFGTTTTIGSNAGFYASIPLWPKKYRVLRSVRVRPPRYLYPKYRFKGGLNHGGDIYSTGENIMSKSFEFNPSFVKNQLLKFL